MTPISERRFIRHPSQVPIDFDVDDGERSVGDVLRNVSDGGVCFVSRRRLRVGARIRLRIPLPGRRFEVQGRVAWCRVVARHFDVGVAFERPQARFAVRMVEQLCYIEEYRTSVERDEGRTLTRDQAAAEWVARFADGFPR
jgi:Tfp pilus assembly protein PilZ